MKDYFREKQNNDQFLVLFAIIQRFYIASTRKEVDIPQFIGCHISKVNGTRKKKVKYHFLQYIKDLHQQGHISNQGTFREERIITVTELT